MFLFGQIVTLGGETSTMYSCVATSPDFPGRPPWAITATILGDDGGASAAEPATFNPTSDYLVATPASVVYAVSDDTTCAPDCQTPWKPGDPWPLPAATITQEARYDGANLGTDNFMRGVHHFTRRCHPRRRTPARDIPLQTEAR